MLIGGERMKLLKYPIYLLFLLQFLVQTKAEFVPEGFLISPKLSFAGYSDRENWQDFSISKVPPLVIQVEKYYNSYLSYGGYIGVNGENYISDINDSTSLKNRAFALAALGTFHFSNWFQRVYRDRVRFKDLDLYCTLSLRWEYQNSKASNILNSTTEIVESYRKSRSIFHIGPIAGVRYYITDTFSMLAEVGGGNLGIVTMGITWRR